MGYLTDNLPERTHVVGCADLYTLGLVVEQPNIDPFGFEDHEDTLALIIREVVPDPEDFQFSGAIDKQAFFEFHNTGQRAAAQSLLQARGHTVTLLPVPA